MNNHPPKDYDTSLDRSHRNDDYRQEHLRFSIYDEPIHIDAGRNYNPGPSWLSRNASWLTMVGLVAICGYVIWRAI